MRVAMLGLLLTAILLVAAPLAGQQPCRKRILVYLDVSGSMKPTLHQPISPYQQVLLAMGQLFSQPGIIDASDAVTVVRFGGTLIREDTAEGPAAAQVLVQRLQGNADSARETDFRAVFNHLASTLPQGVFNRQVALIASDFDHEPKDGMDNGPAIADWDVAWARAQKDLSKSLTDEEKFGLVLFQAPGNPRHLVRMAKVLEDLKKNDAFVGLAAGGGNVDEVVRGLAKQLRKSLFNPPHLQVSRDAEDDSKIAFTVTNPNCYLLHLTRLSVKPKGGEAVFFDVGSDDRELGPNATPTGERVLKRTLPSGESWKAAEVHATVETAEGVTGETGGTTASWLKFKPTAAVFERRPVLSDILRLDLDLIGYTDPKVPKVYTLTFGEDAQPLARANFEAPAFLGPEPRPYRIVLPMQAKGEASPNMRIAVEGAEPLAMGSDRVSLVEDLQASHGNRYLGLAALLAPLGVGLGYFWVYRKRAPYRIFELSNIDRLRWGAAILLAFLLFAEFIFRQNLLRWGSAEWADWWLDLTGVILVFLVGVFLGLEISRAHFAAAVVEKKEPLPLQKYLLRSRVNTWIPWCVGLLVAILLSIVLWPLRPPEARESRRSETPSSLHVTSN